MPTVDPHTLTLLRLTLTPGLGPILIQRAIAAFGSAEAVLNASLTGLRRVKGIGEDRARQIAEGLGRSEQLAHVELTAAESLGVSLLALGSPNYPPLLAQIPDPPPILYIRGMIQAGEGGADRYPIAIVGSRSCTPYGLEQADRFASALAQCGLTIVSGGARGIDTAAHRAAIRARSVGGQARTIAVLGCGLAECYPPDNRELFDQIVSSGDGGGGAIISELPLATPPNAENFPARNRIISGLSLGVLVIEAGRRSGALITARVAAEDHNREVFAIPGRIDSTASHGSLDLIKAGGASLVTHPDDILSELESPARHHHQGTHEARYSTQGLFASNDSAECEPGRGVPPAVETAECKSSIRDASLSDSQRAIIDALSEPLSLDALARHTGLEPGQLRADVTMLELKRRVQRQGTFIAKRG